MSEYLSFEESIYGKVKGIKGSFRPDPNISVALFSFSGDLWVINRPFIGEPNDGSEYGIMEFQDVRVHRIRAFTNGCMIENSELSSSNSWWAIEIGDSEYLRECIEHDQQRTPEALAGHHHYVVYDGWDRVIEIIAKNIVTRSIKDTTSINLRKLFDREESPIEE